MEENDSPISRREAMQTLGKYTLAAGIVRSDNGGNENGRTQSTVPKPPAIAETAPHIRHQKERDKTIVHCNELILKCCRDDGSIVMAGNSSWIVPYFANHAALALLAAVPVSPPKVKRENLTKVSRWLDWYKEHQREDGSIADYEHGKLHPRGTDSYDSTAAMLMLVAERYEAIRDAGGKKVLGANFAPKALFRMMEKVMHTIDIVTDPEDGLTWAKPDHKKKYLMDNVEVYGGLIAAERYFNRAAESKWADEEIREKCKDLACDAALRAGVIAEQLPDYWNEKHQCYATSKNEKGEFDLGFVDQQGKYFGPMEAEYPQGLCNLFALSFINDDHPELWERLQKKFNHTKGSPLAPDAPAERWLCTAAAMSQQDSDMKWEKIACEEAADFTANQRYVHRPAVVLLSLLEGNRWMPSLVHPGTKVEAEQERSR